MPASEQRVALLRAVNVGGHNAVKMADLQAFLSAVGLPDARTVLQTGNIVFSSQRAPGELEAWLEAEAQTRLHLETTFFVRTAGEWQAIVERNPFAAETASDPSHVLLYALKHKVGSVESRKLQQEIDRMNGPERVEVAGGHAYLYYPAGIGQSKLTPMLIERALGTRGTGRNWNTVLKLAGLLG